jgi:hypothetical protein
MKLLIIIWLLAHYFCNKYRLRERPSFIIFDIAAYRVLFHNDVYGLVYYSVSYSVLIPVQNINSN